MHHFLHLQIMPPFPLLPLPSPPPALGSAPFTEKRGFLHKQGGHHKNWKLRYFVLQPGGFMYFKKDPVSLFVSCLPALGNVPSCSHPFSCLNENSLLETILVTIKPRMNVIGHCIYGTCRGLNQYHQIDQVLSPTFFLFPKPIRSLLWHLA